MILVLGAGVYHIPLVKTINQLGYKSTAVSYLSDDPALKFASNTHLISSTDVDKLKQLISENVFDGIITTASDWNTFSQAELNEHFNLKGVRKQQVQAVSQKDSFNKLLKRLDLPEPKSQITVLNKQTFHKVKSQGKHIFKPLKGSGSSDVFTTEGEFPKHLDGKEFVVQSYLEGQELGGQAIIENGQVVFLALSKKELVNQVVPFAHVVGVPFPQEYYKAVETQLNKITKELEFETGTINFDIRVCEQTLYIIDLSFRLSGNGLIEAINLAYNVDLFKHHIFQVLDEQRTINFSKPKLAVSVVFGSKNKSHDLESLRFELEQVLNAARVELSELVWDEKKRSQPFTKSKNRFGHVIFSADNEKIVNALIMKLKRTLGFI